MGPLPNGPFRNGGDPNYSQVLGAHPPRIQSPAPKFKHDDPWIILIKTIGNTSSRWIFRCRVRFWAVSAIIPSFHHPIIPSSHHPILPSSHPPIIHYPIIPLSHYPIIPSSIIHHPHHPHHPHRRFHVWACNILNKGCQQYS